MNEAINYVVKYKKTGEYLGYNNFKTSNLQKAQIFSWTEKDKLRLDSYRNMPEIYEVKQIVISEVK